MVIVDTSAWIEYFRNGIPLIVQKVDHCLERNFIGIGDLIYCEVIQGIKSKHECEQVSSLLLSLPRYDMVGFRIAEKAADNYRALRSHGITIRKTIDVIIGTFCAENGFPLLHNDKDFDFMAHLVGIKFYKS